MGKRKNKYIDQIQEMYDYFSQQEEIKSKYCGKAGIYSLSIGEQWKQYLVYIGKSKDMLWRLCSHILFINNPQLDKSNKYAVLHQAKAKGIPITFDCLYLATGKEKEIDEELGKKEGELIREHMPPLNYQIPRADDWHKYTIQKSAAKITLEEILVLKDKYGKWNF